MSRIVSILIVLIALTVSGLAPAAVAPERATVAPSLRFVDMEPVTLAGKAFKPRERLRVAVAHGDQTAARVLRAGRLGGFVVTFSELSFQRCESFFVRATGTRGSQAILKRFPPACLTE